MPPAARGSHTKRTEELKRRVIDESIKLFLENGYEKTTTRQIMQKTGILNGSLYNIFRSKEEIFSEAIIAILRQSIRESERLLPNTNYLRNISFPLILQIYASSRSPRIAELLAIAYKRWDTMDMMADYTVQLIRERDTERLLPTDAEDFKLRICICLGAMGNVFEMFEKDPSMSDDKSAMYLLGDLLVMSFGMPNVDLRPEIDAIYDVITAHSIDVYGIHI